MENEREERSRIFKILNSILLARKELAEGGIEPTRVKIPVLAMQYGAIDQIRESEVTDLLSCRLIDIVCDN